MSEEKGGFGYFLLGLGLGVAAGVLLAPKTGAETRDLLAAKAGEGTDYLRTRADDSREFLKQKAGESADFLKTKSEDIKDSANDVYEKGRTAVKSRKEDLNAAVEAGKQAYKDAVANFGGHESA